jgi:hypothetical protein
LDDALSEGAQAVEACGGEHFIEMAGCPNTGFFGGDFGWVGVAVEVAEEGGEAFDHGAVGIAEEDWEAGGGVDGFFDPDAGDAAGDAAVGGFEGVGEGMAGAAADQFGEAFLGVGEEVEVFDEGVLFGGEGHGRKWKVSVGGGVASDLQSALSATTGLVGVAWVLRAASPGGR